jgi:hypothetical protein
MLLGMYAEGRVMGINPKVKWKRRSKWDIPTAKIYEKIPEVEVGEQPHYLSKRFHAQFFKECQGQGLGPEFLVRGLKEGCEARDRDGEPLWDVREKFLGLVVKITGIGVQGPSVVNATQVNMVEGGEKRLEQAMRRVEDYARDMLGSQVDKIKAKSEQLSMLHQMRDKKVG